MTSVISSLPPYSLKIATGVSETCFKINIRVHLKYQLTINVVAHGAITKMKLKLIREISKAVYKKVSILQDPTFKIIVYLFTNSVIANVTAASFFLKCFYGDGV